MTTSTDRTVLALDGAPETASTLARLLADHAVHVLHARTSAEALEALDTRSIDVLVTTLSFAGGRAVELVASVAARWADVPVVVLTTEGELPAAIEALRAGAADYLLQPLVGEQVGYVIGKALAMVARDPRPPPQTSAGILGESGVMKEALSVVQRAAPSGATILVRGESGTGKELVARAIHAQSARAGGPFVKIDCASLPETLLESELFGYEKGAFTGAAARKLGRVELAEGGTLFVDEIGELGTSLQAKLLRLLQDREIERLGGTKTLAVDVRVVAATHRDLETMIERAQFREDLFYRLNVVAVWLPPLRARRSDIDALVRHFVATFSAANGRAPLEVDALAMKALRSQRWPGNVRQLQNLIERLVVLCDGPRITEEAVRAELSQRVRFVTQPTASSSDASSGEPGAASPSASVVGPLDVEMREAERNALVRALAHAAGNRALAARLLGVGRSTLYEKLAEHGL